ncbi:UNVERIFIED_ORG: hypothetical protein ABRZ91_000894 [Heyndrickxia coagulans]
MKKLLLMFFTITMITAISGCSLFTKEVDYQKIADDLNKKNMDAILNSTSKKFAKYEQDYYVVKDVNKNEETDEIYINGTFNTKNSTADGIAQRSVELSSSSNKKGNNNIKNYPQFNVVYSNGEYSVRKGKKDIDIPFVFDKLQGLEKIKPDHYTYGLDEPPMVIYKLSEKEFNQIINDDLQIKYDKFKSASIFISLKEVNKKLIIEDIRVGVTWETKENGNLKMYVMNNTLYPKEMGRKGE